MAHISADEDCSLSDVKLESGLASAVGLFHVLILDSNPSRVIMKITKGELWDRCS